MFTLVCLGSASFLSAPLLAQRSTIGGPTMSMDMEEAIPRRALVKTLTVAAISLGAMGPATAGPPPGMMLLNPSMDGPPPRLNEVPAALYAKNKAAEAASVASKANQKKEYYAAQDAKAQAREDRLERIAAEKEARAKANAAREALR